MGSVLPRSELDPFIYGVSDTVTISIDDMLPFPEEFREVNDFETSASVWKNLKIYWINYVYNNLFLFLDANKMIINHNWVIFSLGWILSKI